MKEIKTNVFCNKANKQFYIVLPKKMFFKQDKKGDIVPIHPTKIKLKVSKLW